jgi:hypothetical protein
MQKAKALFDELAAAGRPVSLEDFNLYVFRGLRGEFKDLVTSLITKAEPLSYADLHSHLLTHEFLHKSSACPHPAFHLLLLLRSVRLLAILAAAGAASMVAGVPTSPIAEATDLLAPDLITATSKTPPLVTIGRALGSAIGGRIHAANCVRISAIQLPIALNSSSEVMANNLLPIWCSAISPQPVLLIGFQIPVPINTSHLILPP